MAGSMAKSAHQRFSSHNMSGTFAPVFIKSEAMQQPAPNHIDGENDFSGKRYVWLKHPQRTFVRGSVVEELDGGDRLVVQHEDGADSGKQLTVAAQDVDKVNPAKFDKANDMAELTFLNEPSVVHNLHMRYQADLIYTYSGLFLVTVNPYCPLPIYSREYINMYRGMSREETKPHIFAVADEAFRKLVEAGENQSILVTGESGAGKTENTKKVIQYLAAVATPDSSLSRQGSNKAMTGLSQQILRANPILEAFGNAQTVRNNNSSRFGKFIRIQFTRAGQIAGAFIDWYLLEKSRVVKLNANERSYHIFYQLIRGAPPAMRKELLLSDMDVDDFDYLAHGNDMINGVSDKEEWNALIEAFNVMDFSPQEQMSVLRSVAAILHLGNISVSQESMRGDQASFDAQGMSNASKACSLLGIPLEPFVNALLHPRVKAGREWVTKAQTPEQVRLAIDALAKGVYERAFGDLVERINRRLNRSSSVAEDTYFVGVLDIAGFEIFQENSFEQLCINYTNEKLQQFFNHHMFVLEQEEYAREQIEWQFIDFGKDLQPTIDLIELSNPIGLFSCLDEDSVMPKATDKSFTEKLNGLWDRKSPKYRRSMLTQGFVLTHYAADVEYSTDNWLTKNKDPLPDNATKILANSTDKHISALFGDCAEPEDDAGSSRSRVKKGLFRTVAQRHKEQLAGLMSQLHSTHPHFVRCILPNHSKQPKKWDAGLVLDQLRCNGVLEGIRIARTGFPNRIPFAEFRSRYEVLCTGMPSGYLEPQRAVKIILEHLKMDTSYYRVGLTKVFFRAGVLAELEEHRDALIREIMSRFQSVARGFSKRRAVNKRLYRAEAASIILQNFQVYLDLQANPWWRLFVRMRPMLGATRQSAEMKKRDQTIQQLEAKMKQEANDRLKLDEDRRRAEHETKRVQQTLESERALALDKEEIFRRLQDRETELSEKLAGALDDQDGLEQELDDMMAAKKAVEEQVSVLKKELEHAGSIIAGLESEKSSVSGRHHELESRCKELSSRHAQASRQGEQLQKSIQSLEGQLDSKAREVDHLQGEYKRSTTTIRHLEDDGKNLVQQIKSRDQELEKLRNAHLEPSENELRLQEEVRLLNSQLSMKDRKITELEGRVAKADRELSTRLNETEKELRMSKRRARQLSEEHRNVQKRLTNKRTMLEELDEGRVNSRQQSPTFRRGVDENNRSTYGSPKFYSNNSTPVQKTPYHQRTDSTRSDKTVDSAAYNSNMDLVSEIELLQNQLQMSEMRNRHLQSQVDTGDRRSASQDESPSNRRVQRLEKENFRLHDMLDDSAKKVSTLENSIRTGQLSLKDIQTKSYEELYDLINSQEQSRRSLLQVHRTAVAELQEANVNFDCIKQSKSSTEVELRDVKSELNELRNGQQTDQFDQEQLLQELDDVQARLETESSSLEEARQTLELYKARADDYYNKLEHAEMAVLKATRASEAAKSKSQEASETADALRSEQSSLAGHIDDLNRQLRSHEERAEDLSAELESALESKERLQAEVDEYRSQRARDISNHDESFEQTRRKYQAEFASLTSELQAERSSNVSVRGEVSRLREELETLRAKWDDELLNSSTWSKEKSRLETTLKSLESSRDEAASAHDEAQAKVVNLLSQIRQLRTAADDAAEQRDTIAREKKALESRLQEASNRLEDLARSESPAVRSVAGADREALQLKSQLAQQEDIASAAVGRMRRSEAVAQEAQRELTTAREENVRLHADKASLDSQVRELNVRLVDFETKGYAAGTGDAKFLSNRVRELQQDLDALSNARVAADRNLRTAERALRESEAMLERRNKDNRHLNDDLERARERVTAMTSQMEELQATGEEARLAARRSERDSTSLKEKALRLERELESLKGRTEGSSDGSVSGTASVSRRYRPGSVVLDGGPVMAPERHGSLTKGFL